jgi:hypothetical protein
VLTRVSIESFSTTDERDSPSGPDTVSDAVWSRTSLSTRDRNTRESSARALPRAASALVPVAAPVTQANLG